jgi:hypothetical protein
VEHFLRVADSRVAAALFNLRRCPKLDRAATRTASAPPGTRQRRVMLPARQGRRRPEMVAYCLAGVLYASEGSSWRCAGCATSDTESVAEWPGPAMWRWPPAQPPAPSVFEGG